MLNHSQNRVFCLKILQFYSLRHRCDVFNIIFSNILSHIYRRNFISFILFHRSFFVCVCYQFIFSCDFFCWLLTQTLFRICVNAGGRLWINSGHDHYGYDPLPYEYEQTSTRTFYDGYASLSYGYDPPSNEYGYASTFYGGYTSPNLWVCLSQLEEQHHEPDMNINTRTGLFF